MLAIGSMFACLHTVVVISLVTGSSTRGTRALVAGLVGLLLLPVTEVVEGPRPSDASADLRLVAAAGPTPPTPDLGVQFHGLWSHYDRAKRAAVLNRISGSGARWVRLDVSWAMIQPRRRSYDLEWGVPRVDRVLKQAERRGLRVLVTFWLTPGWANGGQGERVAPDDASDYATALAWAARRWGDRVGAWEVWNEPNSEDFLEGADPAGYTDLLCAAHDALHRQDDTVRVVLGGLMYNDDAWLRRAYASGARGCFDILGVHPYMAPADARPELEDDGEIWRMRHLAAIRRVMTRHDDRRPVWATEFGWSSHRNAAGAPAWKRGVSQRKQAKYAVRAMTMLGRDYPYVKKAFWYKALASGDAGRHHDGYAMLRRDLSPKPVFRALRRLLR
ncbi:cellulase family glycosylhydrolase [Nocardioides donggukensis]|uniref:Cellulase family glycosylhydrolase n=1 Tax=Nocardioides donggukensis TaxID=2774019 RepID=A0A927K5H2_9ACTN|nr:cellulase family glycosylhydrolase [Nocardioides donggukensis]MBD8869495.1 cellulase family glycosylhydrolase [Nocardioides donggukensis]